jgi:hypothetical protein
MRLLLLIPCRQLAAVTDQPPRRWGGNQCHDGAALGFGDPRLPAGTRPIAQPIQPLGIEPHEAVPHRLRMAAQFGGDRGRA